MTYTIKRYTRLEVFLIVTYIQKLPVLLQLFLQGLDLLSEVPALCRSSALQLHHPVDLLLQLHLQQLHLFQEVRVLLLCLPLYLHLLFHQLLRLLQQVCDEGRTES